MHFTHHQHSKKGPGWQLGLSPYSYEVLELLADLLGLLLDLWGGTSHVLLSSPHFMCPSALQHGNLCQDSGCVALSIQVGYHNWLLLRMAGPWMWEFGLSNVTDGPCSNSRCAKAGPLPYGRKGSTATDQLEFVPLVLLCCPTPEQLSSASLRMSMGQLQCSLFSMAVELVVARGASI